MLYAFYRIFPFSFWQPFRTGAFGALLNVAKGCWSCNCGTDFFVVLAKVPANVNCCSRTLCDVFRKQIQTAVSANCFCGFHVKYFQGSAVGNRLLRNSRGWPWPRPWPSRGRNSPFKFRRGAGASLTPWTRCTMMYLFTVTFHCCSRHLVRCACWIITFSVTQVVIPRLTSDPANDFFG